MSNPASNWLNAQPSEERRVLKAVWDRLRIFFENSDKVSENLFSSLLLRPPEVRNIKKEIETNNESYRVWYYLDSIWGAGIIITTPNKNVSYKAGWSRLKRILNSDRYEILYMYGDEYDLGGPKLTSPMIEDMAMMAAFTVVSPFQLKGLPGRNVTHLFTISRKFLNWGDEDPFNKY